ncbi:hypothetical protein FOA52_007854 [Chlamydomonas sp. UWO 241]|nr:hypothetical protein FOA52_007854 [Chlamydomonas sp. UWO 241]
MVAVDHTVVRLRCLVQDCLNNGLHASAVFHADKLVTLSRGSISDTYLLAQCYYASGQYRRALATLRREEVPAAELSFKCLIAKCLAESGEWEECLGVLGDGEEEDCLQATVHAQGDDHWAQLGRSVSPAAVVWLLRGRAFQAHENRPRAIVAYRAALTADPYCYEAFSALIGGHMLNNEEELSLMEGLRVAVGDEWLPMLYRCRCKKYMQQGVVEELLALLEAPRQSNAHAGHADANTPPAAASSQQHQHHQQQQGGDGAQKCGVVQSLRYTPGPAQQQHNNPAQQQPQQDARHGLQQQQGAHHGLLQQGVHVGSGGDATVLATPAPPARGGRHSDGASLLQPPSTAFAGFVLSSPMATTPSPLHAAAAGGAPRLLGSGQELLSQQQAQQAGHQGQGQLPAAGHGHHAASVQQQQAAAERQGVAGGLAGGAKGGHGGRASASCDDMETESSGGSDPAHARAHTHSVPTHSAPPPPLNGATIGGTPASGSGGGPAGAARAGCGLGGNGDVATARAELLFTRGLWEECHRVTGGVLERDPYALQVMPLHLGAALQLGRKSELFMRGHRLVEEYPKLAVSWYAVGLYYMCTRQFEAARRHFSKAIEMDATCAHAWIGFGHAFAALDERDQAMTAYRTAARLFPGLHTPVLGMGMEYCAMNNLQLAERMLLAALRLCPCDPATSHELGVLNYKSGAHAAASMWLQNSLSLLPGAGSTLAAEPALLALGHCLRKQHHYVQALECYERSLALNPGASGTHAAVGLTRQLMGQPGDAVEAYHCALSLRPDDSLAADLLASALRDYAAAA